MRMGLKGLAFVAMATLAAPAVFAESHSSGGDAAKGEKTFKKCKACHQVGEGAKNRTGPILNDIMGRTAGTVEDYKYSKSMIAAGEAGLIWDEALVAAFIENPKEFLREYLDDSKAKSKMSLKLKKEKDRVNVAAYVATFSAAPAMMESEETPATE